MDNRTFIANCAERLGNSDAPTKKHGNLLFQDGVLYSYGKHYPLLFKHKGFIFRNTVGYSSTTGKHVCYAGDFSDHDAKLAEGFGTPSEIGDAIEETISLEWDELKTKLKSLSSRAWKQRQEAEERLEELDYILTLIK